MTGYGSAELERDSQRLTAEIRSVNHRFCEVSLRAPKVVSLFEDRIRQLIADRFSRGKFNLTITWGGAGESGEVLRLNEMAAARYVALLSQLQQRYGLTEKIDLRTLASDLGGMARRIHYTLDGLDVQPLLDDLIRRVYRHPSIHVLLDATITDVSGYVGNFTTRVRSEGRTREIRHGAVVIATGAAEHKPAEYLYGEDDRVLTLLELEEHLPDLPQVVPDGVFHLLQRGQGGDWGWVEKYNSDGAPVLRKELFDVAFALKPGEKSGIIETPQACYIMFVEDKRPEHIKPLNDVRDDIEKKLSSDESNRLLKQWIERLKRKTFVRTF